MTENKQNYKELVSQEDLTQEHLSRHVRENHLL